MDSRISRSLMRILTALMVLSCLVVAIAAQDDPDPNSPTPILVTEDGSTRALAQSNRKFAKATSRMESQAFSLNSRVVLMVANLQLMDGEGASAFRVYAEDKDGHNYKFPVTDVDLIRGSKGFYSLTVNLTDEVGYFQPPTEDGDILVYLTWRGLASNRVRIGLGKMGGGAKDYPDAKPMPISEILAGTGKNPGKESGRSITPEYVGYRWSGDRSRFLEQATFGPSAAWDSRLRRTGLKAFLEDQFSTPYPSSSNPYPNYPLMPANAPTTCDGGADDIPLTCQRDTYTMYQPQSWFFREAFYGDAQLRHRVAWALAQLWVTSGVDIQQGQHMVEYHKILSNNAFGNYRNLMKEMTLNPTMGDYLSMSQSSKTNPNENYAREIMQLFTVGLFMLNPDGTVQCVEHNPCQVGDTQVPTYDQNNVNNLTKVLTGWSFCSLASACPHIVSGSVNYIDPMRLNSGNHDLTAKTLLNYPATAPIRSWPGSSSSASTMNVAVCTAPCTTDVARTTYANASMDQALDNLYGHPNVAPYVSRILIQQLVTSDPSSAYVERIASVFQSNRASPTQLKEVVKAILLDPEARGDVKTDPHFGKLREPVLLTTNFARLFGVRSADGNSLSDGNLVRGRSEFTNMAQTPFMSPTVFNFYPPGYQFTLFVAPDYKTPRTVLNAPELAIMNTGTTIARANFFNRMVFSTPATPSATAAPYPVTSPDSPFGTGIDISDLQALSAADATGGLLVDELNRRMLHNTMSAQMKSTILPAITAVTQSQTPTAAQTLARVQQALYLVATSSQFQVQR